MSGINLIRATPVPSRLSPEEEQARHWQMMFTEVDDLGLVTVPENHNSHNWIERFRKEHHYFFDDDTDMEELHDCRYSNPSKVLKPGDRFYVKVMGQKKTHVSDTTSRERMKFLSSLGAVFTGPQGLFLVWDQYPHFMPNGFTCTSFDEPNRLGTDFFGKHLRTLPYIGKTSGMGAVHMDLWPFDHKLNIEQLFLHFSEVGTEVVTSAPTAT